MTLLPVAVPLPAPASPARQAAVPFRLRDEVRPTDTRLVRDIVQSSGFFTAEEVDIAGELVDDTLRLGAEEGYRFVIAERASAPSSTSTSTLTNSIGLAMPLPEMLGYTCYGRIPGTEASFDLYWIAVHEALRGAGIGAELLRDTERRIRAQGGERIFIETSTTEKYVPTRAFYLRCGYVEEAVLADFYRRGDGKVIFSKYLSPA